MREQARSRTAELVTVWIPAALMLQAVLGACSRRSGDGGSTATVAPAEYTGGDASIFTALEWRSVGPHRGGRAIAVAGDPRDPLVFYFGAIHGFKTSPVGAIEVSRSHPNVVYVGMGEALMRQNITPGDGVYKSTDGGEAWTHVGLRETLHIARIQIHPSNPDVVYVAAAGDVFGTNRERGVYRTKDGGSTCEQVLFKSERASALDLAMDPTNPNVLYASLNQIQRIPWDQISGGPDSGLYNTTDGGNSWTDITRNPGLPAGTIGKVGLAVSPPKPSRVWALIEADDGGLYRSDDGGRSWQNINDGREFRRDAPSYMHVVADPQDPDTVYVPSYAFWKSTDGGANVSLDGGATWSSIHNQPTAELFGLAIDDQVPYRLYAAQNDNSHVMVPSRSDSPAIGWEPAPGGEGGQTAVKPDGSVLYAADRTRIERYDQRNGLSQDISVWPDDQFSLVPKDVKNRFYYNFPILLSPHDPNVLYAAGNRVFKTTNEGMSWEPISPDISSNRVDKMEHRAGNPLTKQTSSLYWVSLAQALAESRLERNELWVGTDDGVVQVTRDGGKSWEKVSPEGLAEWTRIVGIEVSPHARGTAYLAANRFMVSDRTPYLYKTTDYGKAWQPIASGIRENDFARVIREDPVRPGLLYAGTDTGVYVSFDAGGSWHSLRRNLPAFPSTGCRSRTTISSSRRTAAGSGSWTT